MGSLVRRLTSIALASACALIAAAPGANGASTTVTVAADLTSVTTLDVASCASGTAGVTSFGLVVPGVSTLTPNDCVIGFSSPNSDVLLKVAQADGSGDPMSAPGIGRLDTGFSGDGKFRTPVGTGHEEAYALRYQPDGMIVMVGGGDGPSNQDFMVARLTTAGVLDASFDGPGGTGNGRFTLSVGTGSDLGWDVAVQEDGKIVLVGQSINASGDHDFAVVRLNSNGTLDTSFDGDGKVWIDFAGYTDVAKSVEIMPDGRIVVAGEASNGNDLDFGVVRLLSNGELDTTFSGDGRFSTAIRQGNDYARGLAVTGDGSVFVGGYASGSGATDPVVVNLDADGELDPTFDGPSGTGNGIVVLEDTTRADRFYDIAVDGSGRIVATGMESNGTNNDLLIARLTTSGQLDASFDGPGAGNGRFTLAPGAGDDEGEEVRLEPSGAIVVGGWSDGGGRKLMVVRLNAADGTLDTSFDGDSGTDNGIVLTDGDSTWNYGLAMDIADGRIAVGGPAFGADYDFGVAQLARAGSVPAYDGVTNSWSTQMFGMCARDVQGATAVWTVNATCATTNGAHWNGVSPVASTIASRTAGAGTSTAALRFGLRVPTSTAAGRYYGAVRIDLISPGVA